MKSFPGQQWAKAGIHALGARVVWIPACAGMTSYGSFDLELD